MNLKREYDAAVLGILKSELGAERDELRQQLAEALEEGDLAEDAFKPTTDPWKAAHWDETPPKPVVSEAIEWLIDAIAFAGLLYLTWSTFG